MSWGKAYLEPYHAATRYDLDPSHASPAFVQKANTGKNEQGGYLTSRYSPLTPLSAAMLSCLSLVRVLAARFFGQAMLIATWAFVVVVVSATSCTWQAASRKLHDARLYTASKVQQQSCSGKARRSRSLLDS